MPRKKEKPRSLESGARLSRCEREPGPFPAVGVETAARRVVALQFEVLQLLERQRLDDPTRKYKF